MNVTLTPELERWVSERVDGGRYRSVSEVIREGLRLLQEHEEEHSVRIETLRRELQIGIGQLDRGEGLDGEEAFERILAQLGGEPETRS
jgi:antitoxin ParD1/3/4